VTVRPAGLAVQDDASGTQRRRGRSGLSRRRGGPGIGWLGTTAGVTEDGRFIELARFESEQAARRNSDRPEQDQWWTETSKLFTGAATFKDSSDVTVDVTVDPDDAGFV
jgi:hypothetical protein